MIGAAIAWSARGREIYAASFVGVPFKHRGCSHDGADCLGLLRLFYSGCGVNVSFPDYPEGREKSTEEEIFPRAASHGFRKLSSDESPQWGDVILFKNDHGKGNHAGVEIGAGRAIHMLKKNGAVITSYSEPPFTRLFAGALRYEG